MQTTTPTFDLSLIQKAAKSGLVPIIPGYEVVLWEGDPLHNKGKIFCYNPVCPCHKSRLLIEIAARFVSDGLLTPQEAKNLLPGNSFKGENMTQTLWGESKTRRCRRKSYTPRAKTPYSITDGDDCSILGHTLNHWSLAGTTTCMDCGAKIFCPTCTPTHPTDETAISVLCPRHEESEVEHAAI